MERLRLSRCHAFCNTFVFVLFIANYGGSLKYTAEKQTCSYTGNISDIHANYCIDKQNPKLFINYKHAVRSEWPFGLSRMSAAACLLGSRVRIPQNAWNCLFCVMHIVPSELADHSFRWVLPTVCVSACALES